MRSARRITGGRRVFADGFSKNTPPALNPYPKYDILFPVKLQDIYGDSSIRPHKGAGTGFAVRKEENTMDFTFYMPTQVISGPGLSGGGTGCGRGEDAA